MCYVQVMVISIFPKKTDIVTPAPIVNSLKEKNPVKQKKKIKKKRYNRKRT